MIKEDAITTKDLGLLRVKYNLAVKHKKESFLFKGNTMPVEYAKFVIEYLESNKPKRKKRR